MKPLAVLLLFALAGCGADAQETSLKVTNANCSAAFAKSDEPRDAQAAIKIGMLGFAKFLALPEGERLAHEARYIAERTEALKQDTSGILKTCRAQLEVPTG